MNIKLASYGVVLALGIGIGVGVDRWLTSAKVITVVRDNVVTQVVEKPIIETRDVVKFVEDKTEVKRLMGEAATLKTQVQTLSETIGKLQASGSGQIVYTDRYIIGETKTVREAAFKDWRLDFRATDSNVTYALNQSFEAIAYVGRDPKGQLTGSTKLFEIGPGVARTELSDIKTTLVVASPNKPRWFVGGSIQAGVGILADKTYGGIGAFQWLKRGSTKAAEDSSVAILSPSVFISTKSWSVGALPISFNLGRIPKQPFRDLWVSPYVGATSKGLLQWGFALTATF